MDPRPRPDWPVRDSGLTIDFNNANSNHNKINYLLLKETLENFKEDEKSSNYSNQERMNIKPGLIVFTRDESIGPCYPWTLLESNFALFQFSYLFIFSMKYLM